MGVQCQLAPLFFPSTPRRIQDTLVNSPAEVRAGTLQGADVLGQLPQRAQYSLLMLLEAHLGHLGKLYPIPPPFCEYINHKRPIRKTLE